MQKKRSKGKAAVSIVLLLIFIPAVLFCGAVFFEGRRYAFLSAAVAVLSCVPFFVSFERRAHNTAKLIIIAVMIALSVAGRVLLTPLPAVKPVSAVAILTGIYFGGEAGFMTGSLSALISNFYFGQGGWTPFQMFAWGFIGLAAGLLGRFLRSSRVVLGVYAAFSGVIYSLFMDLFVVLWAKNEFDGRLFLTAVSTSALFMAVYAVSNVIFALLLSEFAGPKLDRIKSKYGIF